MKLIKLKENHYIIVDDSDNVNDSEIKEGDWYENNGVIFRADDKFDEGNNPNQNEKNKKITHSTQPLNTKFNDWFDAQIITLQEVKELLDEGMDVEKKVKDYVQELIDCKSVGEHERTWISAICNQMYTQALEDNKDKKYTLEDLEAAACFGMILEKSKDDKYKLSNDEEWEGFIQSLQPKTEWEYVGECKGNNGNGCFMDSSGHDCGCYKRVPKTSWEVEFIDGKLKLKQ